MISEWRGDGFSLFPIGPDVMPPTVAKEPPAELPEFVLKLPPFQWSYCTRMGVQISIRLHGERNHQGLDNQLIESLPKAPLTQGPVLRRERLGGMLSYYYREAA